ncbi:hypothetical protein OIU74_024516 [Salix koriyanagi]|uniref:Uncharacterized protein n=1 Tax=Salix koriyanagi TaxID=2511006 RepID=A0A9Q0W842_9ROSI|nr:hypothetical protein OIU74_024516 [Salix koriyanagi]
MNQTPTLNTNMNPHESNSNCKYTARTITPLEHKLVGAGYGIDPSHHSYMNQTPTLNTTTPLNPELPGIKKTRSKNPNYLGSDINI